jgi:hypothetical protein
MEDDFCIHFTPLNVHCDECDEFYGENEMTLRDYFAAKAMQGLLAGLDRDARRFLEDQSEPVDTMSKASYTVADAMLKARQKDELR